MKHYKLLILPLFILSASFVNLDISSKSIDVVTIVEAANENGKAIDPVCKMSISKDSAQVVDISGKKFYFCGDKCKETFQKDPGKIACMCFVGMEPGDEMCDCKHCSGGGGKCKCGEEHGHGEHHGQCEHGDEHGNEHHGEHGHEHGGHH